MNETVLNIFLRDGKNGLTEEFNVLSLFDGMSCGQIALNNIGLKPTRYYAAEIKKHAIQCTLDNFPDTIQIGDVTKVKGRLKCPKHACFEKIVIKSINVNVEGG
jgi:DNA (cytosine-5)-methyltransferase 3A